MTAEEYFQALLQRNPAIAASETVKVPSRAIRAIVFQAHAEGVKEGRKAAGQSTGLDAIFGGGAK